MGGRVRAAHRRLRGTGTPLKVLDLTEFFSPYGGGVRTYLAAKAQWCAYRDDIEHVIVAPGPRTRVREWYGSRLYELAGPAVPASPGYHALLRPGALGEILERELPQLIELGSIYLAPWALRIATRGIRIAQVGFLHMDLTGAAARTVTRRWPDGARRATDRTLAAYLRAAYSRCRIVMGASESAVAAIRAAGIGEPRLVPFGVDLDTFRPEARDTTWKQELGAAERPVALYVGRLAMEKNLGIVLDALPELHRRLGLKLVCIGEGAWRTELERLAAGAPEMLVVLPYETDRARLARAYASADVFLAPCEHETFGLAVLEAAACGLPTVGADAGALAGRLKGATWARTFRPGSAASLADAVVGVLALDTATIREDARRAASAHGWARTFGTLIGIYREVCR